MHHCSGPNWRMQRMRNFKHIHAVEAGINTLIAFIVGAAVQHFVIDRSGCSPRSSTSPIEGRSPALMPVAEAAQTFHEIVVQTVSDIQPQTVDVKFIDPASYAFQKIIWTTAAFCKIQLDQFKMYLPSPHTRSHRCNRSCRQN